MVRRINQARGNIQRWGPTNWAKSHLSDYKQFMDKVDIELAQEAHDFLESFSNKGRKNSCRV